MSYAEMLEAIEREMGPAPRRVGWRRRHWKMRPPKWLRGDARMRDVFKAQPLLLSRGRPVWAAIVQANNILFSNTGPGGSTNAPGDILFSEDPASFDNPLPMLGVARMLFSFKEGPAPDPEAAGIGAMLADELLRKHREPIPAHLSPDYPTVMTSIFYDRLHLPWGMLGGSLLPVLTLPEETDAVMVVPSFFWPRPVIAKLWGR